jgi:hypothetical protein
MYGWILDSEVANQQEVEHMNARRIACLSGLFAMLAMTRSLPPYSP